MFVHFLCKHAVKYVRKKKRKNNIISLKHNCHKFHAEVSALKNCNLSELNGCTTNLYVIRINKKGLLKMSKPCFHCIKFMNKITKKYNFNIKIYYSNQEGNIICSTLHELTCDSNIYVSTRFKK